MAEAKILTPSQFGEAQVRILEKVIRDTFEDNLPIPDKPDPDQKWAVIEQEIERLYDSLMSTRAELVREGEETLTHYAKSVTQLISPNATFAAPIMDGIRRIEYVIHTEDSQLYKRVKRVKALSSSGPKELLNLVGGRSKPRDDFGLMMIVRDAKTPAIELRTIYEAKSPEEIFKILGEYRDRFTFSPRSIETIKGGNFNDYFKEFYRIYKTLHALKVEVNRIDIDKISDAIKIKNIVRRFKVFGVELFDVDQYGDKNDAKTVRDLKQAFNAVIPQLREELRSFRKLDLEEIYYSKDSAKIDGFFEKFNKLSTNLGQSSKKIFHDPLNLEEASISGLTLDQLKWHVFRIWENAFQPNDAVVYFDVMKRIDEQGSTFFIKDKLIEQGLKKSFFQKTLVYSLGDNFEYSTNSSRNLGVDLLLFEEDRGIEGFYKIFKEVKDQLSHSGGKIFLGKGSEVIEYWAVQLNNVQYAFARKGKLGILLKGKSGNKHFIEDAQLFFKQYFVSPIIQEAITLDQFDLYNLTLHGPEIPPIWRRQKVPTITDEEKNVLLGFTAQLSEYRLRFGDDRCTYFKDSNGYESGHFNTESGIELKIRTELWDLYSELHEKALHTGYKMEEEGSLLQRALNLAETLIEVWIAKEAPSTLKEKKLENIKKNVTKYWELQKMIAEKTQIKHIITGHIDPMVEYFKSASEPQIAKVLEMLTDIQDHLKRLREEYPGKKFLEIDKRILQLPIDYVERINYQNPDPEHLMRFHFDMWKLIKSHDFFKETWKEYKQRFDEAQDSIAWEIGKQQIKKYVMPLISYFQTRTASNISDVLNFIAAIRENLERLQKEFPDVEYPNLNNSIERLPHGYIASLSYSAPRLVEELTFFAEMRYLVRNHQFFKGKWEEYKPEFDRAQYLLTLEIGKKHIGFYDPIDNVVGLLIYFVAQNYETIFSVKPETFTDPNTSKQMQQFNNAFTRLFEFTHASRDVSSKLKKAKRAGKDCLPNIVSVLKDLGTGKPETYESAYRWESSLNAQYIKIEDGEREPTSPIDLQTEGYKTYRKIRQTLLDYFRRPSSEGIDDYAERIVGKMMKYLVPGNMVIKALLSQKVR